MLPGQALDHLAPVVVNDDKVLVVEHADLAVLVPSFHHAGDLELHGHAGLEQGLFRVGKYGRLVDVECLCRVPPSQ